MATLGITAASTAQNVPSYIPTDGLVGWWPFNGNANDESGNGNNGTVNGAALTSDRNGITNSSYNFNVNNWSFGSGGDNIYIPYNPSFNFSDFTLSTWVNRASAGSAISPQALSIIKRYQYGYNNPSGETWLLTIGHGTSQNGALLYGTVVEQSLSPAPNFYAQSNQVIPLNLWCHVIMTYSQSTIKLYINNQLVGTTTDPSISINTIGNSGISIGLSEQANGQWEPFDGSIDDIGIWSRALTPQEISALYTASSTNNNETANTTANVPGAISYQAVARDTQGAPLADTNVQVQFTLITDSLSGAEEYVETHSLTTNSLGLFTTAFGGGTPVSNTFDSINWSAGNKFLNVQIDTGNGLVDMGTQQLLSTPYSLHSATAGAIKNPGLPIYSDNAAALAGGLSAGDMYRTGAGVLMVVY